MQAAALGKPGGGGSGGGPLGSMGGRLFRGKKGSTDDMDLIDARQQVDIERVSLLPCSSLPCLGWLGRRALPPAQRRPAVALMSRCLLQLTPSPAPVLHCS